MDRELLLRGLALGLVTGLAFFGAEELANFALAQPPLLTSELLQLLPLYMVVPALVGAVMGALGARQVALAWWIWAGTASFMLGGRLSFQLAERTLPGWPGFGLALLLCGGAMVGVLYLTKEREQLRWGALAGAWTVTVLILVANLNALGSAFSAQALGVDLAILVLGAAVSLAGAKLVEAGTPKPLRITLVVALTCWIIRLPLPAFFEPQYPEARRPSPDKPAILMVVVDTLRADRLGASGYDLDITPNLDRLADRSFVYTQAMAGAGWTLPAFASILTGMEPDHHGVGINNGERNLQSGLAAGARTLPRYLQRAGYSTGGIVTNAWLKSLFGLDQGFDYYDDALGLGHMPLILQPLDQLGITLLPDRSYTPADRQADKALAYIKSQGATPWFLMLHFMDLHGPYNPPVRHLAVLPDDYADPVERLYDAEIRFMDEQLGRVLAALPDNTWVVVTADHGEEFGEHPDAYPDQPIPDGTRHGHSVYDELVRVPLMVYRPQALRPGLVDRAVRTTDILPTLLSLTDQRDLGAVDGLPLYEALGQPVRRELCEHAPPTRACQPDDDPDAAKACLDHCPRGVRDLYEALDKPPGEPLSAWPSVAEAVRYGQERKALRLWPWKLIHGADRDELYNLADDPSETVDLLSLPAPAGSSGLPPLERASRLMRFLDGEVGGTAPVVTPEIDPKTEQQLRNLGYIE
jgi:arylsulfatase A-like enzyme